MRNKWCRPARARMQYRGGRQRSDAQRKNHRVTRAELTFCRRSLGSRRQRRERRNPPAAAKVFAVRSESLNAPSGVEEKRRMLRQAQNVRDVTNTAYFWCFRRRSAPLRSLPNDDVFLNCLELRWIWRPRDVRTSCTSFLHKQTNKRQVEKRYKYLEKRYKYLDISRRSESGEC